MLVHHVGRNPIPKIASMKTCFECEAEVPYDAEFCHKCGRRVTGVHSYSASSGKSRRGPNPDLLAKSKEEHTAIRADILYKAKTKAGKTITFFLSSSFVLAMLWAGDSDPDAGVYFGAFFVILVLSATFMGRNRWLTQEEYYSITGSRNHNGEHRCIFCGNKGIYRQGEYAGNTKYAQCSKCQEPLFFH